MVWGLLQLFFYVQSATLTEGRYATVYMYNKKLALTVRQVEMKTRFRNPNSDAHPKLWILL